MNKPTRIPLRTFHPYHSIDEALADTLGCIRTDAYQRALAWARSVAIRGCLYSYEDSDCAQAIRGAAVWPCGCRFGWPHSHAA